MDSPFLTLVPKCLVVVTYILGNNSRSMGASMSLFGAWINKCVRKRSIILLAAG